MTSGLSLNSFDIENLYTAYTLIEFAKFGVETVSMSKTCNFDSNISDFNSVDLKKAKK